MELTENEQENTADESRMPYETPDLIDHGDVSKLTQTGINTTGPDSGYS